MHDVDQRAIEPCPERRSGRHWLVNRLTAVSVCVEALEGEVLDCLDRGPEAPAVDQIPVADCCRHIQSILDEIITSVKTTPVEWDERP